MSQPSEQPVPSNPHNPTPAPTETAVEAFDPPPEAPVPTEPIAPGAQPMSEARPVVVVPGGSASAPVSSASRAEQLSKVWMFVGVLIVLSVLGGFAIMRYRKIMLGNVEEPDDAKGLMDSLRALRDSGEMSEEEYQQTRRRLAAQMAARFEEEAAERREARARKAGPLGKVGGRAGGSGGGGAGGPGIGGPRER